MLSVLASFAEFEREMTATRIAETRAYLKSKGRRIAEAVPFGYTADPRTKELVVVPEEAEIVSTMFLWAAAKVRPSTIAARLGLLWEVPVASEYPHQAAGFAHLSVLPMPFNGGRP